MSKIHFILNVIKFQRSPNKSTSLSSQQHSVSATVCRKKKWGCHPVWHIGPLTGDIWTAQMFTKHFGLWSKSQMSLVHFSWSMMQVFTSRPSGQMCQTQESKKGYIWFQFKELKWSADRCYKNIWRVDSCGYGNSICITKAEGNRIIYVCIKSTQHVCLHHSFFWAEKANLQMPGGDISIRLTFGNSS